MSLQKHISSSAKLEVSNQRILKFYQNNPHISFEAVNLLFLDLFEKIIYETNETLSSKMQSQLLTAMHDTTNDISELKENMASLKDSMNSRFTDIKKEYIEEVRNIVQDNNKENIETLGPLLEKNNNVLIDKTNTIMNDILPKNAKQTNSQLNELFSSFHKTLSEDTSALVKSPDNNAIKEFISNFELKTSVMLQNIQQPMYSFISASEERINNGINALKDGTTTTNATQQKIIQELGELLNKFRDHQTVQKITDKQLHTVLTKMYHTGEISVQSNTASLLLKRIRKPTVLIQSRDTPENVTTDDISTFMQLIDEQNTNGIFISQQSGISGKKNYQIEMHNNNIIVFVHSADYTPSKIEVAIDIIDNLNMRLRQFKTHNEDDCTVPKDVLDAINNEYQLFLSQKIAVVELFKENQKKILCQIDEIRFPSLDKYLSTKYSAPIQKPGLKCDMCKSFNANNLKALAAHKRGCARKQTNSIAPVGSK
jgi:hypothetical protein